MKKYLFCILFFSIFIVIFLYGCCTSKNDVFVSLSQESEPVYREVVIDEKGRMPRVSFPTGTIMEAPEEMTLQPGIKVVLSEQKFLIGNSSVFSDSSNAVIYEYKVNAVMKSTDPLVSDTIVTTVEKPFSVFIPNDNNLNGMSFVGVKEDNTSPWRYFQIPTENNMSFNDKNIRNAKKTPLSEYKFYQYRFGSKFVLSTYNNKDFTKLPETIVSSLTASAPASILVKDGKYLEDLEIKGLLIGSGLDSFKPSDFYARITYRNNREDVADIKVNGVKCKQITAVDKTVPGKSYVHSFTLSNITEASLMSGEGNFSFKLGLKDIDTELFSSGFLIEFYNKIESKNIYPYIYTEFINIKKTEKVDFSIVSDNRNILDSNNQLYRCNPSFTVSSDYDFSESDWAKIASAVRIIKQNPNVIANARLVKAPSTESLEISGETSETENNSLLMSARASEKADYEYITDGVTKTCQNNKLLIAFNKNLDSDSIYTIKMEEPDNIDGINIVPFDELTFKTAEDVVFTISSNENSVIDLTSQIYCVDPIFYISANNSYFSDSDWVKAANAICVTNLNEDIASKTVNGDSITLFFTQSLENDKQYTVSMSEIKDIDGLNIVPLASLTFTTQSRSTLATLTFTLTPDEANVFTTTPSELYICRPTFIVTPSFAVDESNRDAIENAISIDNYADNKMTKAWDGEVLKIGFNSNLSYNTAYTLSMNNVEGLEGIICVPFENFTFTTKDGFNIVMTSDDGDVFTTDNGTDLYQTRPTFTATANMPLSAEDREKIENAITVSNIDPTKVNLNWNDDSTLVLSFTENLATNTQYTVSMADIDEIDGVPLTSGILSDFRTIDNLSFNSAPSNDSVYAAMSPKYRCNPEFIITPNYSLNDDNKTAIENAITVSNAEGVTKTWDGDSLKITFSQPLAPDSAHSISMGAVNITGVSISPFEPIDFTTVATLTLALTADDGNVFISTPTELYHCHPAFTITPSFNINETDREIIVNSVTINNNAIGRMTKIWDGNNLKIGFSPDLDYNTSYTISMSAIDGIDGVPVTTPDSVSFTTMNGLTIIAASNDDNVFITLNEVPLYKTLATFTITTNMVLSDENKTKIYNAVSVSNVDPNMISKIWSDDTTLTLGFKGNLATGTEYSISLAAIQDMNGVSIPASTLYSFRTMDSLSFTATPDEGSIYTAIDQKCHLRPSFTVTPNYTLTDVERTAVFEAVSVSNTDNVTKEWEGNDLKIAFSSNLLPDSAHSVTMSGIASIPGVLVTPFDNLDFTTLATLTFNVVDDADNVYNPPSTLYHCRPAFTITPSFTIKDDDKSKISDAISVTNTANIISKAWDGNNLRITFTQNLATNTAYTLSMAAVQNMDNIIIATFTDKAFNTMINDLNLSFSSNPNNAFSNSKFHCRPSFTITPSFTIRDSDKTAIESAVVITNVDDSIINKTWDGNILKLNITQNIATNTTYTLSMAEISDAKGVKVNSFNPFTFTTIPDLIITIATASLNCDVLKPDFYISTNISLSNGNLAKISNALTVSGDGAGLKTIGNWSSYLQGLQTTLSFSNDLTASTTYIISLSEIAGFEGVPVKAFTPYEFTTFFFKGKGKDTLPFLISTPAQLACLNKISQTTYYYKQMEDLNLSSYTNWQPIGSSTSGLRFDGIYDGNNKTISNLVINRPNEDNIGMFGYSSVYFSNLVLEDIDVTGKNNVGCLIGNITSGNISKITISNSKASGTRQIGSLVGYANNNFSDITLTNCEAHGTEDYVGGLCGQLKEQGQNSRSMSNINASYITISGKTYLGGIAGISRRTNHTNVVCEHITVTGKSFIGGAFGGNGYSSVFNNCSIRESNITGTSSGIGGFIGYRFSNTATFNNVSCNNISVSGGGIGTEVGGFIGKADYINTSNIICKELEVKGIAQVGGFIGNCNNCSFQNCSVLDSEIKGGSITGGFIGQLSNTSNSNTITGISKCFAKNTQVKGNNLHLGGFVGFVKNNYYSLIDSCYVNNCSVIYADPQVNDNYSISSFVGYNSGTISNCYVYGSTVTGKTNYGALVGVNGDTTTLKDCFVYEDHDTLVGQIGANCVTTNCYYGLNDMTIFRETKTWSDGKTVDEGSTAWSNFDTSSLSPFPPQLSDYPEP